MDGRYAGFIESCEEFIKYIDRTENYKKACLDKISECERKLSDLDHLLGLENVDGTKMMKISSHRKKTLKERWKYKDELEYTETLIKRIPNIQGIYNTLRDAKNAMKETEKRFEERQYAPNILFELFPNKDNSDTKIVSQTKRLKHVDKSGIIKGASKRELRMEKLYDKIEKRA